MKRVITGILLAAAIFSILFFKQFLLGWAFMLIVGGIGLHEYFSMTLSNGETSFRPFGIILGIFPLLIAYTGRLDLVMAGTSLSLVLLFLMTLMRYKYLLDHVPSHNVHGFLARMVFGIIYIGFLGSHVIVTFKSANGPYWLILFFLIIGMSDSCAYYAGRFLGKHKLCPNISPGKTVEGFLGGIFGATGSAVFVAVYLFPQTPPLSIAIIAVITTVIGVMGDLVESIIKRSMHVKDSGSILPGHGGLLDRMDSLLVSAPAYYYMISYLSGGLTF